MKIYFHKAAAKYLEKIPGKQASKILSRIEKLAASPDGAGLDVKPLCGTKGSRLRIGKIRVIYRMENNLLIVMDIGPRGGIYKR